VPLYDYECEKCGNRFEAKQSIHDEPLKECQKDECEGEIKRVIGLSNFELRGSCWARDGYNK
jgi:putative FmdB family regulatory protein